jgi:hypothetical protein
VRESLASATAPVTSRALTPDEVDQLALVGVEGLQPVDPVDLLDEADRGGVVRLHRAVPWAFARVVVSKGGQHPRDRLESGSRDVMPRLKQVARDASLLRRHRREFADGGPQCPPDLSVDAPLVGVRGPPIHDPDSGADLRGRDEDLAQVRRVSGRGVDGEHRQHLLDQPIRDGGRLRLERLAVPHLVQRQRGEGAPLDIASIGPRGTVQPRHPKGQPWRLAPKQRHAGILVRRRARRLYRYSFRAAGQNTTAADELRNIDRYLNLPGITTFVSAPIAVSTTRP